MGSHPAGESREGVALFGWGFGPPQLLSAPLPAREVGGRLERGRAHSRAPVRNGNWSRPQGEVPAPAGESREGAALFGGGLGEPPTTFRFASR